MSFEDLVQVWDSLPAAEAVARAWLPLDAGRHGGWHKSAREEVEYLMPLLARGLDRLLVELDDVLPSTDWRLWSWPEGVDPRDAVRTDRIRRHAAAARR